MDKVSIISVTYRSLEETRTFVESIQEMTNSPYEFIMGANGIVEDSLKDYLHSEEAKGRMRVVWNPKNIGVRAFNQVMRLASTPYIIRCDSDILIRDPYWVKRMVEQHKVSQAEIGMVAAVGTANTLGYRIRRTPNTVETDMIMSNCMLIHAPTVQHLVMRLGQEYPRMSRDVIKRCQTPGGYPGLHGDLQATLEYVRNHAPWWDLNYGGYEEPVGYGADDMWWSIMARWAGLKLVTSQAGVVHHDASMRPGYEAERHRLVSRGFQYMRTSLSLIMDEWRDEIWKNLPHNLPVLADYRASGALMTV